MPLLKEHVWLQAHSVEDAVLDVRLKQLPQHGSVVVDMLAGMLAQASLSLRSSLAAQLKMVLTLKAKKTPTLCAPASTEPSLLAQCTAPSQVPASAYVHSAAFVHCSARCPVPLSARNGLAGASERVDKYHVPCCARRWQPHLSQPGSQRIWLALLCQARHGVPSGPLVTHYTSLMTGLMLQVQVCAGKTYAKRLFIVQCHVPGRCLATWTAKTVQLQPSMKSKLLLLCAAAYRTTFQTKILTW